MKKKDFVTSLGKIAEDQLNESQWERVLLNFARTRGDKGFTDDEWHRLFVAVGVHLSMAEVIQAVARGDGRFTLDLKNGELAVGAHKPEVSDVR